jgi:hypothetical protein
VAFAQSYLTLQVRPFLPSTEAHHFFWVTGAESTKKRERPGLVTDGHSTASLSSVYDHLTYSNQMQPRLSLHAYRIFLSSRLFFLLTLVLLLSLKPVVILTESITRY